MIRHHQQEELAAGDDWEIFGTLLNSQGQPFPLAGAALEWALKNEKTGLVVAVTADVDIVVLDADAGKIRIDVPHTITENFVIGRHWDTLRLTTTAGARRTMWKGAILVSAEIGE